MHIRDLLRQNHSRLNDFLAIEHGRLIFGSNVDLLAEVQQYGTPLEIAYCPQITHRVHTLLEYAHQAAMRTGYPGQFVYAYATKANFAEEVIRTAISAGAHYETSSAFDVRIATRLWHDRVLPESAFVFCNGSKEPAYLEAILELRQQGFANLMPILDDPQECAALLDCPHPLVFGVRERKDAGDFVDGATYGYDRFGMLPEEIEQVASMVRGTRHRVVLYHAMVGSQLEDEQYFIRELRESLVGYARARQHLPELTYFNIGGGLPTSAYALDFRFDYAGALERLMHAVQAECASAGVPVPHLVGEFGRYTVADHSALIFRVTRVKAPQPGLPNARHWYLVDGSLMVALPDILIVTGQEFITLPLNYYDHPFGPVMLGGRRTCDSDDFYPRDRAHALQLPIVSADELAQEPLYLAFFGVGAYQTMLSGEGGAHHCLAPEAQKLIIEDQHGTLQRRHVPEQTWQDVLHELGYRF